MGQLFAIILVFISFSSSSAEYPTKWKFINSAKKDLTISCTGKAKGLKDSIILEKFKILSDRTRTYVWSDFQNDGMGLNYADWNCKGEGLSVKFTTDWGESIKLFLTESDIKVIKKN